MTSSWKGLWVALATPFAADGELDLAAFRRLVRHVVDGGVDVLVPLGTTGEASTLVESERDLVITACLEEARGRPVVAGTGHHATRQAALWTARARSLGAHGALVVTPYYNKPSQAGIVAHFAALAGAVPGFPLVAYNVPGRTGVNLLPATVVQLWENPSIAALKESSGNLAQIAEIARTLPEGRVLLAGDDNLALASLAVGAAGLVSVAANVIPRAVKDLLSSASTGAMERARTLDRGLRPLMDALFLEPNPVPVKAALDIAGICGASVRLPLLVAGAATRATLRSLLGAREISV